MKERVFHFLLGQEQIGSFEAAIRETTEEAAVCRLNELLGDEITIDEAMLCPSVGPLKHDEFITLWPVRATVEDIDFVEDLEEDPLEEADYDTDDDAGDDDEGVL